MGLGIFNSTSIPVVEQVANFTEARHEVLAGNVANMDTPGYRSRDLSVDVFQDRLKEAIRAQKEKNHPVSQASLSADPDRKMREVKESMKDILYHDESDVGLEQQVLQLSKNNGLHTMAVAIMASQFKTLDVAIRERV